MLTLNRTGRLVVMIFAIAIFVDLAYFSIRNAMAVYYSQQKSPELLERAVRLEPGNAENWYLLGNYWQYDLVNANPERAIQAYRLALSLNPDSPKTWLELASVYEGEGAFTSARQAYLRAKETYPLSAKVSWGYGNFLVRMGEQDASFCEIRRAVEADPQLGWQAFVILRRYQPDVGAILDSALPHDSSVYLDLIWNLTAEGNADSATKVWDRLFNMGGPTAQKVVPQGHFQSTQQVLFSLVDRLLAIGSVRAAHRVWDESLRFMNIEPSYDRAKSLVWDGGFESEISGRGFAWRMDAPRGSVISVDKQTKHSGARSLRVRFDGKQNVDFHGVCQYVMVSPETVYDVSVWLQTAGLTSDSGVFFRLDTPGSGKAEMISPELTNTYPWTQFKLRWKAAADVRLLQLCLVRNPSRNFDRNIAGTVWIDDVDVVPEGSQ